MLSVKIRIRGLLAADWSDWFHGLEIVETRNGESVLQGIVIDAAAFHGLLGKVYNLGLELLLVEAKLLQK